MMYLHDPNIPVAVTALRRPDASVPGDCGFRGLIVDTSRR
jgi:hypothetical protein